MVKKVCSVFSVLALAGLIMIGCATSRQVRDLDDNVNKVRLEQKDMKKAITRIDSLLSNESDASVSLRAEIRSSVNDLLQEFETMRANLNDLQALVSMTNQRPQQGNLIITPPIHTTDSAGDTTRANAVIPGVDCQELYDESFINVYGGKYEEAIQGFADYLNYCNSQDLADDARFWTGECYYFMKKYNEAISEFDLLLKDYPNAEKRPSALYKTARSYEELGRKNEAKRTFQTLIKEFPESLEAEQAKDKLKEL